MRKYGGLTCFLFAAIPNPLFDIAGLAAGTLRYPLWRFYLSAGLGKIVKSVVFAFLGVGGIRFIEELLK